VFKVRESTSFLQLLLESVEEHFEFETILSQQDEHSLSHINAATDDDDVLDQQEEEKEEEKKKEEELPTPPFFKFLLISDSSKSRGFDFSPKPIVGEPPVVEGEKEGFLLLFD